MPHPILSKTENFEVLWALNVLRIMGDKSDEKETKLSNGDVR